ncbi:MAG: trimethylamine methyltransferase family protein, partial [Acidiferrobacterales bacterium]
ARDLERIHQSALEVLNAVGIAGATPEVTALATEKGCSINEHGRLSFPPTLIENIIAAAAREYVVYSRSTAHSDLHVGGNRVHYSTSGEAVTIFEADKRHYRPSTLVDLYDACRLVDRLEYIHQFGQTVVPTDIEDLYEHDINVAYALVSGTQKPFEMTFNSYKHIKPALELFDLVLGGEGRFAERPFCTFGGCPIVSPLRFAEENLNVLVETSRLGLVNDIAIAPQAGATAPVSLAGTLVQVTAEALACLAVVNMIRPGCPMTFAMWPFVSDLRTGAFSGGSGEEAVLAAAAVQIGTFYDLPNSVGASMTDSKIPDAQAGYEKGVSAVLAGLAGCNRVLESAGMLGSLMGCSFEALVIDNEMLGMVQRTLRGIEVTDETLGVEVIKEVTLGVGHYLGHSQTLAYMETEYLYPELADRQPHATWEEAGATDMLERARHKVTELLSSHYPAHMGQRTDDIIRERFPIRLSRGDMQPGNDRW